jgi:NADH-quinone oxidoreductase subunit N
MGKLMVFKALVGADHEVLAAIAILFAVVGAYYYIRIIQQMYFEHVEDEGSMVLTSGAIGTGILVITGLSLLGFGLLPNALLNLA